MVEGHEGDGTDVGGPMIAKPGPAANTVVERPARATPPTDQRLDAAEPHAGSITADLGDDDDTSDDPEARFVTSGELSEAVDAALGAKLPALLRRRGLELELKGAWAVEAAR